MSVETLKNLKILLELSPDYPPSETTWQQILNLVVHQEGKQALKGLDKVRYSLLAETQALENAGTIPTNTRFNGTGLEELPPGMTVHSQSQASDLSVKTVRSLPEPMVIRFYHQEKVYYLDTKNQIYEDDPDQHLIAHLVGRIEGGKVIIHEHVVHELATKMVSPKEVHGRHYYLGMNFEAYRGLVPGQRYIWRVGKLNDRGKIELSIS